MRRTSFLFHALVAILAAGAPVAFAQESKPAEAQASTAAAAADSRQAPQAAAQPPETTKSEPTSASAQPTTTAAASQSTAAPSQPTATPSFSLASEIDDRLRKATVAPADREDRDEALKVYAERGGSPIWVDEQGLNPRALAVMGEIKSAEDYGLSLSAFRLPELSANAPSRVDLAEAETTLTLAALKYARHARGGRLNPASLSKNFDRQPVLFRPASILAELATAPNPEKYLRSFHPQHDQFERLRLKYVALRSGQTVLEQPAQTEPQPATKNAKSAKTQPAPAKPISNAALERKLLANLEMWRWMPVDLGDYHIKNNVPEFTTRMVRGGKTVHLERIVAGKVENQTPIFSDEMEFVVFKPFWNVPTSIKWKELQPQLMRNPDALSRVGLRAAYNGREVDPATVDWATADMRAFHVFQPPGSGNALGQVKFMFPNKHDVYMHDTPHKSLFNNPSRAYSHGCMRVRDPLRFAELLLAHDKGWDLARVTQLANSGPENNEVRLTKKVPVHVTYFTATVEDDGKLRIFNDIYGHETRVHLGLEGKAHLIVNPREEKYVPPSRGGPAFVQKSPNSLESWMKSVFNF
jgi:murein L,D-transpeptidase YcbB/YkuD